MLNKVVQVGLEQQTDEGAGITDMDARPESYAGEFLDHSYTYQPKSFDRGIQQASLSKRPEVKGSRMMAMGFTPELIGGSAAGVSSKPEARWHNCIQGAGFVFAALKKVTVSSVSPGGSVFVRGQIITDVASGSPTKRGLVVYVSSSTLVYLPLTGTFAAADTIYNDAVTQVSATINAPAAAGWRFTPQSETADNTRTKPYTLEMRKGGEVHHMIDARCTAQMMFEIDKAATIKADWRGLPIFDPANDGRPLREAAVSGVPTTGSRVGVTPLAVMGTNLKVGSVTDLVCTKVELDLGIALSDRQSLVAAGGNVAPRITDRVVKFKIDPEYVVTDPYDLVAKAHSGVTFGIYFAVGKATHANGLVICEAPALQLVGDLTAGERNNLVIHDLELAATGLSDDEVVFDHVLL